MSNGPPLLTFGNQYRVFDEVVGGGRRRRNQTFTTVHQVRSSETKKRRKAMEARHVPRPEKTGEMDRSTLKSHRTGPPDFAIDGETNEKTRDPERVKEIYLKEGTIFLRKKLHPPGPAVETETKYEPAPPLSAREN